MLIKSINENIDINISIKKIRLPKDKGDFNECEFIDLNSYLYNGDFLYHCFFKEFKRNKNKFYNDLDDNYLPYHQNEYDCRGIVDLIPVIETKESLAKDKLYLIKNIPFKAVEDNVLICMTRINYWMAALDEGEDYKELCNFLDDELSKFVGGDK